MAIYLVEAALATTDVEEMATYLVGKGMATTDLGGDGNFNSAFKNRQEMFRNLAADCPRRKSLKK